MEFLLHGLIGAVLFGLIAAAIGWWWSGSPNWWIVSGISAAGFVLCGLLKDHVYWVFASLVELLWWWW
jgi:hypothetical protein